MAAEVLYVADPEDGVPYLALVIEGPKAEYVSLTEDYGPDVLKDQFDRVDVAPTDSGTWSEFLRTYHSSALLIGPFETEGNFAAAKKAAKLFLEESSVSEPDEVQPNAMLARTAQAFDDMYASHPEFIDAISDDGESVMSMPPESMEDDPMLLFVAQALGEIDPEGPNGWIIRALAGEEVPDDVYVSFGPDPEAPESDVDQGAR